MLLAILPALPGCGRVGYDAIRVASANDATLDARDAVGFPDLAPVDQPPELPLPVDAPPDATPDLAPPSPMDAAGADVADARIADAEAACTPGIADDDWIADFEAGAPRLRAAGGRADIPFALVKTGEGQIGVGNHAGGGFCGSRIYMTLSGAGITAGRGHVQGQFRSSAVPAAWQFFDARRYRGVRLRLRSNPAAQVSLKITDRQTISSLPYDHFSVTISVSEAWTELSLAWGALRQSGNGDARPALDVSALEAIELVVLGLRTFELQVDDIAFVR